MFVILNQHPHITTYSTDTEELRDDYEGTKNNDDDNDASLTSEISNPLAAMSVHTMYCSVPD